MDLSMEGLSVTLNNGLLLPVLGFGTGGKRAAPCEVGAAVEAALKAGYRHFDCAHIYGNESEVGEAFQKCFKEGVVKREDIFVTSKLWCSDHASEDVLPACRLSLKCLQLEYLDLYLVHFPLTVKKGHSLPTTSLQVEYDAVVEAECWKIKLGSDDIRRINEIEKVLSCRLNNAVTVRLNLEDEYMWDTIKDKEFQINKH